MMKGAGRKRSILRQIAGDYYTYILRKKKICDVRGKPPKRKCIKWHYEMIYVANGRFGGKKKKPAVLDDLSQTQIGRLKAWRKSGKSLDTLHDQIADWGFSVSRKTVTRFFKTHKIVRDT